MDLSTIIGIISGLVILLWGISMGGSLSAFLHFPSFLIVMGGVIASTLINYPIKKLVGVLNILKIAFTEKALEAGDILSTILGLAEIARREGLLALEDAAYQLKDGFLQKGILLIVDGTDPDLVRNIMETELVFLEARHKESQGIFEYMGSLAPAFGLLGTIIGLINMLKSLDNPDAIGPGMAVALITTFYGSVFANLFFIPIAGKLKVRSSEEILLKEVMIEGMLSIQAGENPRIIEEKLKAFLAPELRDEVDTDRSRESGENIGFEQTAAR